ncbi:hypothetical protein SKAU_G00012810 [Synaphobranchus kaupii]|uniref:RRM domain-containing protein n=1 Tax=Synaphobranchus kaupii TaxID=118154 RepID=A0A9Q1JCC5_SYNKA|nr:hypothetical protein SKAU_G00012810 [Synaphobranchus kaupii]
MASGHCRSLLTSSIFRSFVARHINWSKVWKCNKAATTLEMVGEASGRPQLYHHWTVAHLRHLRLFSHSNFLSQKKLSTETRSPFDEGDYPPLPEYNTNPEPESKEVFIIRLKGLAWSCSPEDVLKFFSECRIRDGVNGIHLTLNRQGKPNGEGFIELEQEEDVLKALEKHRQYLGSRYVEVYEVTNREAEAILINSDQLPAQDGVVKLRGLPYSCTEKDVAQFFSGLEIVPGGVTMVMDHRGRNSGHGFVEFVSQEVADQALAKHRQAMGSRYIEVFPSQKSEVRSQNSQRQEVSPSLPAVEAHIQPESRDADPLPRSHAVPIMPIHYVHMRGLPFEASGRDIVTFFAPMRLKKILIEYGPDGRATGEADVFFGSHEDSVSAMSKDKAYMHERYIELFLNSPATKH